MRMIILLLAMIMASPSSAAIPPGQLTAALEKAQQISNPGSQVFAYLLIAQSQAKTGDRTGASKTLEQAQDIAAKMDGTSLGYIAVAYAQVKMGDAAGARKTLDQAKEMTAKRDPLGYIAIAFAQIKTGDVAGARKTIDQAQKMTALMSPDDDDKDKWMTYMVIAYAQAEAGDVDGVKEIMTLISNTAIGKVNLYRMTAKAQAKAGRVADARKTFHQAKEAAAKIDDYFDKMHAYAEIADAQAEVKDVAGVKETVTLLHNAQADGQTYLSIAVAQAKAGDVDAAQETAATISDGDIWKVQTYGNIALIQANAGDMAGARKTLEQVQKAVEQISGRFKMRAYWIAAAVQAKLRDTAGARKTIDQAKKAATERGNNNDKDGIYWINWLIATANGAKTTEQTSDDHCKASAYEAIAVAQAKAGDMVGAKETIALIQDREKKDDTYLKIAQMQAEKGNLTEAMESIANVGKVTMTTLLPFFFPSEYDEWL